MSEEQEQKTERICLLRLLKTHAYESNTHIPPKYQEKKRSKAMI